MQDTHADHRDAIPIVRCEACSVRMVKTDRNVPIVPGLVTIKGSKILRRIVGVRRRIESLIERGKCVGVQRQVNLQAADIDISVMRCLLRYPGNSRRLVSRKRPSPSASIVQGQGRTSFIVVRGRPLSTRAIEASRPDGNWWRCSASWIAELHWALCWVSQLSGRDRSPAPQPWRELTHSGSRVPPQSDVTRRKHDVFDIHPSRRNVAASACLCHLSRRFGMGYDAQCRSREDNDEGEHQSYRHQPCRQPAASGRADRGEPRPRSRRGDRRTRRSSRRCERRWRRWCAGSTSSASTFRATASSASRWASAVNYGAWWRYSFQRLGGLDSTGPACTTWRRGGRDPARWC